MDSWPMEHKTETLAADGSRSMVATALHGIVWSPAYPTKLAISTRLPGATSFCIEGGGGEVSFFSEQC